MPKTWSYAGTKSGYVDTELFKMWFEKMFIPNCGATEAEPALLLMDNHECHVTLSLATMAVQNHVHIILQPPHSSHFLQPLDMIFRVLKDEFAGRCQTMNLINGSIEVMLNGGINHNHN